MNAPSSIAVIIVNYNGGQHLRRSVASLAAQTLRPRRVIVIDNGSTDGSLDGCEAAYPGIEIHRLGRNSGFAEGNNIAARLVTDCEWIALLNPDAFAAPDWLEQLMAGARNAPGYDVFACRLVTDRDTSILDGAGDAYRPDGSAWPRYKGERVGIEGDTAYEVFGGCGAGVLYRRAAFEDVGGFDERYFCYHEDVDLAFRLRLRGYRCLYLPQAVARHVGSAVSGWGSDFSVYYAQRNMVWTYVKNMPGWSVWLYLPGHLLVNLISVLLFLRYGRGRVILRAKWHALRALPVLLSQRRAIQKHRRASPADVLGCMDRGNALSSLIRKATRAKSKNATAS